MSQSIGTENVAHSRLGGKPSCGEHAFHEIEEDVLFSGGKVYEFMARGLAERRAGMVTKTIT